MQGLTLKDLVDSAEARINEYLEKKNFQNYTGSILITSPDNEIPSMEIYAHMEKNKITEMEVTQHPSEIKLTKRRGRMLWAERKYSTVSKRPYREIFGDLEKSLASEGLGFQTYSFLEWVDNKKPVYDIHVLESKDAEPSEKCYMEGKRKIPLWYHLRPLVVIPSRLFWRVYGGRDISAVELLASKPWDLSCYCSVRSIKEYPSSKKPADSSNNITLNGMKMDKMEKLFDEIDKILTS
jgi:hypothetical protein